MEKLAFSVAIAYNKVVEISSALQGAPLARGYAAGVICFASVTPGRQVKVRETDEKTIDGSVFGASDGGRSVRDHRVGGRRGLF